MENYPLGTIHTFDFDGTLTRCDTLLEFLRYRLGWRRFLSLMLRFSPLLLLMKAGLYPGGKAKEWVFNCVFGGMAEGDFNRLCQRFAEERASLMRPRAVKKVRELLASGDKVVVISASVVNWVEPFLRPVGHIVVLGTMVEVSEGRLTGRFLTKNCRGKEKVNRLLQLYPEREQYRLVAYGDSSGDAPLLDFADEGHYKPFRSRKGSAQPPHGQRLAKR